VREKVSFKSGRVDCAGYLFRPAGATALVPCIILGSGFGSTMDRLFGYAERFAAAGFAALAFDYRSFGESGGEPRQVPSISGQLGDFRAAIRFARNCDGIDPKRIALWGNSLGGGHVVVVAAGDPQIAAVVSQVPYNGFPKRVEGRTTWQALRLVGAMVLDAIRGRFGLSPFYIPLVGPPGTLAVVATEEANAVLDNVTRTETRWRNIVAPRGLLEMIPYKPGRYAKRLKMPLLLCLPESDRDIVGEAEIARPIAEQAPHGEIRMYPYAHLDFYRDDVREIVATDQISFLRTYVLLAKR
jgi:pimeloyl-ACP methyl ester carboxylesterase